MEWEETERALRAAVTDAEPTALAPILAADVAWTGTTLGACDGRDEVLAAMRTALAEGRGYRVIELRRSDERLLLGVLAVRGTEHWQVLTLGPDGRIVHIQSHPDAGSAIADLEPPPNPDAGPGVDPDPMPRAVNALVPFVHVGDVSRSVAFYRLLGFEVADEHRPGDRLLWAWLASSDADLMLAEADEPVDPRRQAVLFYLYCADLAGLRAHLRGHGLRPGPIVNGTPGPRREMRLTDPDGYCLIVAQDED